MAWLRPRSAAPHAKTGGSAANGSDANGSGTDTAVDLAAAPSGPLDPIPGRLGDLLVSREFITSAQLTEALLAQPGSGKRIGELLVDAGLVDEAQLSKALAAQFEVAAVDLGRQTPDPALAERLSETVARSLMALPLREVDGVLEVVVGDLSSTTKAEVEAAIGAPVRLLAAPRSAVRESIDRTYRALAGVEGFVNAYVATETAKPGGAPEREDAAVTADSPVARVVTLLVTQALRDRASDIHLEPSDTTMRVRFRIDGTLHEILTLPMSMSGALISRIKILAHMNIVERRRAQDGQFATEVDGRGIDVRVSTMATVWGEKCVLRVLDKSRPLFKLGQLGMPTETHKQFSHMVRSPFGMVLCAGPTGSGKTTTLYATLGEVDQAHRNVVTIEDPVEYVFPSINQIQTNEQAGIGFADGLRAVLRQDPDVILVGEIRDIDTARTAVQAALTGHFVLSSLHATDSVAALHRFLDMGIEAFLVASSVLGIVSQRLVRRICESCSVPYEPSVEELAFFVDAGGKDQERFMHGEGCNLCAGTGYRDRIGVYEFLKVTPEIRRLLVGWATQDELRRMAVSQGMRTLRQEGVALVEQEITTIAEIIRSIYAL
jgi:type IV pilus assembly protein PilB